MGLHFFKFQNNCSNHIADTLSKLQLDSAKMEQEKSEISSQIKEVLSKVA